MLALSSLALMLVGVSSLVVQPMTCAPRSAARAVQPSMGLLPEGSLAMQMFGTLKEAADSTKAAATELAKKAGIDVGADEEEEDGAAANPAYEKKGSRIVPDGPSALETAVAGVDARAQTGEVNFRDFLTMARTMAGMDSDLSACAAPRSHRPCRRHRRAASAPRAGCRRASRRRSCWSCGKR